LVEGFTTNVKGTLPVPKMSLTVNEAGIPLFSLFKQQLRQFGDLTGAKVTRIRTFAKFLSAINFPNGILPIGFQTDEYAEFPRDVYYIDRLAAEDKLSIQFELASLLDIEGIKLPARMVTAQRCVWSYRGEGCEYSDIPVATENDEVIKDSLSLKSLNNRGQWNQGTIYKKGDYVYIVRDSIPYFFVCKNDLVTSAPPNLSDWVGDACSKSTKGCRLRFKNIGNGTLPFGGFTAVNKV
jgi:lambda family phage minor tail protein L